MSTMRPTRPNLRLPLAAVLGAALAATALAGSARAGDDSDRPIDQQIIHNILTGIGLQDPSDVPPTYRERSPLVIPSNDQLPPPGSASAAVANNPAWPKDPDVERAKQLAAQRAKRIRDPMEAIEQEKKPLMPDQLGPKYPDGRIAGRTYDASSANQESNHRLSPSQLGYTGGLFGNMFGGGEKQEAAQFTGEPSRTSLTEPPPGYQTPSPSQPYGLGQEASKPKATDPYLDHGSALIQK